MTTCSPGLTPESSTVCPSTEPPPDPPSVTSRIAYPPPVATKTIVLSPIMAIAPEGTLTAPAGAGPDSDMLVARPAMMPGPAGISALRTTERVAGSSEEHTSELQSLMRISYGLFCLKKKKKKFLNLYTHCRHQHIVQRRNKQIRQHNDISCI